MNTDGLSFLSKYFSKLSGNHLLLSAHLELVSLLGLEPGNHSLARSRLLSYLDGKMYLIPHPQGKGNNY